MAWPVPSKSYERMWKKYVPSIGRANTQFGETLRCASRVIYRYYNDGDIYRIGFGVDTVSPSLKYLKHCGYFQIENIADEIAGYVQVI